METTAGTVWPQSFLHGRRSWCWLAPCSFSYFTGRSSAVNIALVAAVAVCVVVVAYLLYERKKVKGQREYQPLTVAAEWKIALDF